MKRFRLDPDTGFDAMLDYDDGERCWRVSADLLDDIEAEVAERIAEAVRTLAEPLQATESSDGEWYDVATVNACAACGAPTRYMGWLHGYVQPLCLRGCPVQGCRPPTSDGMGF